MLQRFFGSYTAICGSSENSFLKFTHLFVSGPPVYIPELPLRLLAIQCLKTCTTIAIHVSKTVTGINTEFRFLPCISFDNKLPLQAPAF